MGSLHDREDGDELPVALQRVGTLTSRIFEVHEASAVRSKLRPTGMVLAHGQVVGSLEGDAVLARELTRKER